MNLINSFFLRRFGIEIEVEPNLSKVKLGEIIEQYDSTRLVIVEQPDTTVGGWAESKSNDYWHVKYDSTCGPLGKGKDFGYEIASYVGSNLEDLENISNLGQALKNNDAKINENCGLHIHVDAFLKPKTAIGTVLANWLKIEPVLFHSFPSHRKYSKWCKSIRGKANILKLESDLSAENVYDSLAPQNLEPHDNNDKKVSLNLVGYERYLREWDTERATLEFRIPECSLDPKHIKNCTLFFIHFVNTVNKFPVNLNIVEDLDEFFEICNLGGRDVVLDKNLFDLKIWFLKRLMKYATLKKWQKNAEKKLNYITKLHN